MHSQLDTRCEIYGEIAWCWCCGCPAEASVSNAAWRKTWRCEKHVDRNPCAIEGCSRTTSADGSLNTGGYWLCGTHWKIGVPPHSMLRRQYHRYFRLAKRHGWEAKIGGSQRQLRIRFWTFWDKLVKIARERCSAGDIDIDEINRMFGWDDDGR